ncbi:RtcB family protein, partial [Pectobacterium brasiliense]|nr:RtcB family protein [Pectobacterium brasiliense]
MEEMKTQDNDMMSSENSAPVKMWTQGVTVEPQARDQLLNTAKMPY